MQRLSPSGPVAEKVRPTSRLGFRLMVTFGIVLMPLAALSYVQTRQYQEEAARRAEAAVLGATMQAAAPLTGLMSRSQGAVAALAAALAGVADDPVACNELLARFYAQPVNRAYSFVGFVPRSLQMDCSPQGPRDLTGQDQLVERMDTGLPTITVNQHGMVSGTSVLIFSHPVRNASGAVVGLVSLSIPQRALATAELRHGLEDRVGPEPVALITFDSSGHIMTSSVGLEEAAGRLPQGIALTDLAKRSPRSFRSVSVNGFDRVFAVVPLADGNLFLLGNWALQSSDAMIFDAPVPVLAFPVLMWLASLLVAQLASEHQVLRHLRALRRAIADFSGGSRRLPETDLEDAPMELRALGQAFERMMEAVVHDEAELEDMVHQKEVLLREVHHRVKNNLQLIASIINMQIRKARSPETRGLLKGLQDRVMSLATIHRELYQTTGLTDIRADELMQSIVTQILRMAARPGDPFDLQTAFDDVRLTPDQAVPLSLLLTEALTNALKYAAAPAGERPRLRVSLCRTPDGRARVRVINSVTPEGAPPAPTGQEEGTGLGDALLRAFAAQLGGKLDRGTENGEYHLSVEFAPRALTEAEERERQDDLLT